MTNSEAIAVLMEQKRYVHENSVPDQALDMGIKALKNERKKGKWRHYDGMCSCSVCHSHMDDISPFCPMCGADMRGENR